MIIWCFVFKFDKCFFILKHFEVVLFYLMWLNVILCWFSFCANRRFIFICFCILFVVWYLIMSHLFLSRIYILFTLIFVRLNICSYLNIIFFIYHLVYFILSLLLSHFVFILFYSTLFILLFYFIFPILLGSRPSIAPPHESPPSRAPIGSAFTCSLARNCSRLSSPYDHVILHVSSSMHFFTLHQVPLQPGCLFPMRQSPSLLPYTPPPASAAVLFSSSRECLVPDPCMQPTLAYQFLHGLIDMPSASSSLSCMKPAHAYNTSSAPRK